MMEKSLTKKPAEKCKMDDVWMGNNFWMYSCPMANHGGYQLCIYLSPHAPTYLVPTKCLSNYLPT